MTECFYMDTSIKTDGKGTSQTIVIRNTNSFHKALFHCITQAVYVTCTQNGKECWYAN